MMSNANTIQWNPGITLHQVELAVIEKAFAYFKENKTQTAAGLKIAIRTLDEKLLEIAKLKAEEKARAEERQIDDAIFLRRSRGLPLLPEQQAFIEAGLRMQSIAELETEQSVPVPVGKDVSRVLPKDAHRSSASGRR